MADTVFEWCREAGRKEYNTPGEFYMPELETSFLIRCTRRTHFDEGKGRLRRHLIIISPPDTVKSSITSEFLKSYCGAISRINKVDPDDPRPTYLELQGGTTWESLRGGYVEGTFTKPQLHDVDFLYASEFFSFFGHSPNEMMGKIDQFNVALEEGTIVFNQKTAKGANKKSREEFAKWAADEGIRFNMEECSYEYECGASAIFCTRPFTEKQEKAVDSSGFLGRNAVVRWDPDDDEIRNYYDHQFGEQDKELTARIRAFNDFAWRTAYEHVPAPPNEVVDKLVRDVNSRYKAISMRTGRAFDIVRPKRDRMNITQLLVAFSIARSVHRLFDKDPTAQAPVVPTLEYTNEDPILDESLKTLSAHTRRVASEAKVFLERDGSISGCEKYQFIYQPELVDAFKATGCARGAAYRRVAKLREAGHISFDNGDGSSTTRFRIADHIIEDAGYRTREDLSMDIEQFDPTRLTNGDYDQLLEEAEEHNYSTSGGKVVLDHAIHKFNRMLTA